MPKIKVVGQMVQLWEHKQTNGQTDGRYQVHYLPRFAVDKKWHSSILLLGHFIKFKKIVHTWVPYLDRRKVDAFLFLKRGAVVHRICPWRDHLCTSCLLDDFSRAGTDPGLFHVFFTLWLWCHQNIALFPSLCLPFFGSLQSPFWGLLDPKVCSYPFSPFLFFLTLF